MKLLNVPIGSLINFTRSNIAACTTVLPGANEKETPNEVIMRLNKRN